MKTNVTVELADLGLIGHACWQKNGLVVFSLFATHAFERIFLREILKIGGWKIEAAIDSKAHEGTVDIFTDMPWEKYEGLNL
jgi:hypothetical protein